jgi:peroxiredoxin
MKKRWLFRGLFLSLLLVLAACTTTETMEKEDDMAMTEEVEEHDEMDKDDEMKDDDMAKEDDMEETVIMNDGKEAPDFMLMDTNGNTYNLSDYKGEKVYVKYWASWCSICLAGLDEIDQLSAMDKDFTVLTIVTPDHKGEKSTDEFIEWFNSLGYENIVVLLDQDGEYKKQFGVVGVPTSVFIGTDQVVAKLLPGHKSNEDVKELINGIY